MHQMRIVRDIKDDPLWDDVGISVTDFRPHFDGDLVSLTSCVSPASTLDETVRQFIWISREIAQWFIDNRQSFGPGDHAQIVVGWPLSIRRIGRQVVTFGGELSTIQAIADGSIDVPVRIELVGFVFTGAESSRHAEQSTAPTDAPESSS